MITLDERFRIILDWDDGIEKAFDFADKAHQGQVRKYSGYRYIVHPLSVANKVAAYASDWTYNQLVTMYKAALLHDTIEDTDATKEEIAEVFGDQIAELVDELTNRRIEGNRAFRKAADKERLTKVSKMAKAIKIADLIDNSKSIVNEDKNFAKVFVPEKEALLKVIGDGDKALAEMAWKQLREAKTELGLD